jgi:DNA invertase Pin-like site-specific DNA recombinase
MSVAEPDLMASDPTRVLMRQLMGAVAQYDKSQIVAKLRGARMRKRAQEGRCEGRKPYGFYAGESEVIARMAVLRAEGLGFDTRLSKLRFPRGLTKRAERLVG